MWKSTLRFIYNATIELDTLIYMLQMMEKQVTDGRAKAIGLSNFNIQQIQRVLDNCKIKPDNLQIENHLYLQQPELVEYCKSKDIVVTAYSCLGAKGGREAMGLNWT